MKRTLSALMAGIACAFAGAAQAADAVPDFSGLWGRDSLNLESPLSGPGPVVNLSRTPEGNMDMSRLVGDYNNPILKPEAAAILKKRGEMSLAGISVPNPHDQCYPEPPPLLFAVQFAWEMLQGKDEIVILYSHDNKVRHVRLNAAHPANLVPTWQGDSVGHYEGDTLVIDTIGITTRTFLDDYQTPHTEQLHVVERFHMTDGGKFLEVDFHVEDPGAFTKPWDAIQRYKRVEPGVSENVPPVDNDATSAVGLAGPLLEETCAESNVFHFGDSEMPLPQAAKLDF